MSSSNRFLDDSFSESNWQLDPPTESNSFSDIDQKQLAAHLEVTEYDEFLN